MPRSKRLALAGIPLHITQRGVNHTAIFVDDDDRWHYMALLARTIRDYSLAMHAYVLMDNHVHLLMSADVENAVSAGMRQLGQCYVQAFNRRHARSGALWQGRFKSSLVDSDRYLLAVYRYIELNPVRAGMVDDPRRYRWSSIHGNLGLRRDPLLTPHAAWIAEHGADPGLRACRYRAWLSDTTSAGDVEIIRRHLATERALGTASFTARIESALGRPARVRPVGRPKAAAVTAS